MDMGAINQAQERHFRFIKPGKAVGDSIASRAGWLEWVKDSYFVADAIWEEAYKEANSYNGKKSAAEVFGLDSGQYMRCNVCHEVWHYSFKLPLPVSTYIGMLDKKCPKCGDAHICMLTNNEGAQAMGKLAERRAKAFKEEVEAAGRFKYHTLDDLEKSASPKPAWLTEITSKLSETNSKLEKMEQELQANILLTGKPMVDAIISRVTKLEGAVEPNNNSIKYMSDAIGSNTASLAIQSDRITKLEEAAKAVKPDKQNSDGFAVRYPDAVRCTIVGAELRYPDDGKGEARISMPVIDGSTIVHGGVMTASVPLSAVCQSKELCHSNDMAELWNAAVDAMHAAMVSEEVCKDCKPGDHQKALNTWYSVRDKYGLALSLPNDTK